LKQGIEDGFLAPYKVIRIDLDKDLFGWRPEKNKTDKYGQTVEDRIYNQTDFDRTLVLEKRAQRVALKVAEFLNATGRFDKTIVFCEDIDHAERMRQALCNANAAAVSENHRYVMRITGDNEEGKAEIDNFIDPESRYPVIVTTSKLLATGVDAQTCKLIVLDRIIRSMTEFKQIIGRGTRICADFDKFFFTIMDFKKATELFADSDFDGEPVHIYEPGPDDPVAPADDSREEFQDSCHGDDNRADDAGLPDESSGRRIRYVVDDVDVFVVAERVQYYGKDGKLITESLKDYTRKTVLKKFASLDHFLKRWNAADRKKAIIAELEDAGVLFQPLADVVGRDFDSFDLICHVVYDRPPLTRSQRARSVKKHGYFKKYGDKARAVLNAILDKYADQGIADIESMNVLKLPPINRHGTVVEIVNSFGGKKQYQQALKALEKRLYRAA